MLGDVTIDGSRWRIGSASLSNPRRTIVARTHGEVRACIESVEAEARSGHWVAGYIGYDAAPGFNPRLSVPQGHSLPLVWFGVYDSPMAVGHSPQPVTVGPWEASMSRSAHAGAVASIRRSIEAGDTYQANLTFAMTADFTGETASLFARMVRSQRKSYAALIDLGTSQVVSVSPELFLQGSGRTVMTKPMKGTASRGRSWIEDEQQRSELVRSEKERAGNIMIVDLLRNDLGRVSVTGSVAAPQLFEAERHPTVWQLTSTVESQLNPGVDLFDLLAATFPSGSVTGAPKVSTMDIIAGVETVGRGVYCGAIGYLEPGGERYEFSVAIRTGVVADGRITYHVGGGITYDSIAGAEYEECQWKSLVVTSENETPVLLETMRYQPDKGIELLQGHLQRLSRSASYWDIPLDLEAVGEALSGVEGPKPKKVRLLVAPGGGVEVEVHDLEDVVEPVELRLSGEKVDASDPLWFHKTADRSRYPASPEEGVEVLMMNLDRELTETNISNLLLRFGETWVTPPVESGCVPGVYRQSLLDAGVVAERRVTLDDLREADEVAVTNAVRGYRKAVLIE